MANSWLQGNIAKTQSTIAARDAASQARKRGMDSLLGGIQTGVSAMKPFMQSAADVQKQESLYGAGTIDPETGLETGAGVARQFSMDTMGKEHELKARENYDAYKKESGKEPWALNDKGEKYLTNEYFKWLKGQDYALQWDRSNADKSEKFGSVSDFLYKQSENIIGQNDMEIIDPETNQFKGFKGDEEQKMIDGLTNALQRDRARYGISWGDAKNIATEYVKSMGFLRPVENELPQLGGFRFNTAAYSQNNDIRTEQGMNEESLRMRIKLAEKSLRDFDKYVTDEAAIEEGAGLVSDFDRRLSESPSTENKLKLVMKFNQDFKTLMKENYNEQKIADDEFQELLKSWNAVDLVPAAIELAGIVPKGTVITQPMRDTFDYIKTQGIDFRQADPVQMEPVLKMGWKNFEAAMKQQAANFLGIDNPSKTQVQDFIHKQQERGTLKFVFDNVLRFEPPLRAKKSQIVWEDEY